MNESYALVDHGTLGEAYAHRVLAENALGRPLKFLEHVHHVNYDKRDNRRENLVICDSAYHRLIHQRTDALNACGNPNHRKCNFCGEYDSVENMYVSPSGSQVFHRECQNKRKRDYSAANPAPPMDRRLCRSKTLSAFGEVKRTFDWASDPRCVVDQRTLVRRVTSGWSVEAALTTKNRLKADDA